MSENEYTPTTEEIAQDAIDGFEDRGGDRGEGGMRFDRWLAEHDREVAAKAWDEGWVSAMQHEGRCQDAEAAGQGVFITKPKNPYRGAPEQEGKGDE